jgi:hypothetical protein
MDAEVLDALHVTAGERSGLPSSAVSYVGLSE